MIRVPCYTMLQILNMIKAMPKIKATETRRLVLKNDINGVLSVYVISSHVFFKTNVRTIHDNPLVLEEMTINVNNIFMDAITSLKQGLRLSPALLFECSSVDSDTVFITLEGKPDKLSVHKINHFGSEQAEKFLTIVANKSQEESAYNFRQSFKYLPDFVLKQPADKFMPKNGIAWTADAMKTMLKLSYTSSVYDYVIVLPNSEEP